MKKILSLAAAALLAGAMTVSASGYYSDYFDSSELMPQGRLTDNADILSETEEDKIEDALDDVSEKYGMEVLVYTTKDVYQDTEEACMDFAFDRLEQYLDARGESDGIIFVVDMDYRLWNMSTKGNAEEAITESYGLKIFDKKLVGYLSDGEYETCFLEYAELCEEFFVAYDEGKPYGATRPYITAGLVIKSLLIGAVIGLVAALIVTSLLKKQLRSVQKGTTANNFVRQGSFKLETNKDLFLYKNVTKVKIQSSSGGGGGRIGGGSRGGSRGGRF